MKLSSRFALLGFSLLVATATACHRWDDHRIPDINPGTPSPGLSAFTIFTGGGDSAGQPAQNAGDGGSITITATAGRVMLYDGRSVPAPAGNFLTAAVMDDGQVSYAELVSLQAPVLAGAVATFNLVGVGFWLGDDVEISLADAPYTGVTPATDVLGVAIISDEAIRLDDDVVTTRVGNDAVDFSLTSTHVDGVAVLDEIDARGLAGFDGGNVSVNATAGALFALGQIWTYAGDATAVLGAGQGGNVALVAGLGDLLLRAGSLGSNGGLGQQDGGSGGNVTVSFGSAGIAGYNWGISALGGMGRDGNGGDGGSVGIGGGAYTNWYVRVDTRGGDANTGLAGSGGAISVNGFSHSGTIETDSSGGNTSTGTGGDGGDVLVTGTQIEALLLDSVASGGRGDTGGQAASVTLESTSLVEGCWVLVIARGGNGITLAGDGGQAVIAASLLTVTIKDSTIYGDVRGGGASGGTGGNGGDVLVIENTSILTNIQNVSLSGMTDGGNGQVGGDGGDFAAISDLGLVQVSITGSADGGDSTIGAGGNAGDVVAISDGGSVDAWFDAQANGGIGVGGAGGAGGNLRIVSSNIGVAGGSAIAGGSFDGNGGSSDTTGGAGGTAFLDAGDTGNCTLNQMQIYLGGGSGNTTGGAGGMVDASVVGTLNIDGGTIDLGGGGSAAGMGGAAGSFQLYTDEGSVLIQGLLRAMGGTGATGGGVGGSVDIQTDFDNAGFAGDVLIDGTIMLNGGNATAGTGGVGGDVQVVTSGAGVGNCSVLVYGSITAHGGSGTGGGGGGLVYLTTDGLVIAITGVIQVNASGTAGLGGDIVLGDNIDGAPALLTLGASARLIANGAGTGLAGTVALNPVGAGPNNPNLVESINAFIQTNDGNGTDQTATNVTRD